MADLIECHNTACRDKTVLMKIRAGYAYRLRDFEASYTTIHNHISLSNYMYVV